MASHCVSHFFFSNLCLFFLHQRFRTAAFERGQSNQESVAQNGMYIEGRAPYLLVAKLCVPKENLFNSVPFSNDTRALLHSRRVLYPYPLRRRLEEETSMSSSLHFRCFRLNSH